MLRIFRVLLLSFILLLLPGDSFSFDSEANNSESGFEADLRQILPVGDTDEDINSILQMKKEAHNFFEDDDMKNAVRTNKKALSKIEKLEQSSLKDFLRADTLFQLGWLKNCMYESKQSLELCDESIGICDKHKNTKSNDVWIKLKSYNLICKGIVYLSDGKLNDSIKILRESISTLEQCSSFDKRAYIYRAKAYTLVGNILAKALQNDSASKNYERGLELTNFTLKKAPDYKNAYCRKALLYLWLGQLKSNQKNCEDSKKHFKKAIRTMDQYLYMNPSDIYMLRMKGLIYLLVESYDCYSSQEKNHMYDTAAGIFNRILKVKPNDSLALQLKALACVKKAICFSHQGQFESSLTSLKNAKRICGLLKESRNPRYGVVKKVVRRLTKETRTKMQNSKQKK